MTSVVEINNLLEPTLIDHPQDEDWAERYALEDLNTDDENWALQTKPPVWPEGTKHDKGKPRLELVSPGFIEGVAKVLSFGASKYEARNWEQGIGYDRVYGALLRHLNAWWGGEALDAETGESHLYHAGCCLMFLSEYERKGMGKQLDERK
jgi:hypothetical protein